MRRGKSYTLRIAAAVVSCLVMVPSAVMGAPGGVAARAPGAADPAPGSGAGPGDDRRQRAYAAAAAEFGVPERVLLAVSYLESRWDVNAGAPSTAGGYGPMHLTDLGAASTGVSPVNQPVSVDARGDETRPAKTPPPAERTPTPPPRAPFSTLVAAAALIRLPVSAPRADPVANIRGGAALLASYQRELAAKPSKAPGSTPIGVNTDPGSWYGAVARYSQAPELDAARGFADEAYEIMASGAARVTDDGFPVRLPAAGVQPDRSALRRLGLTPGAEPADAGTEQDRVPECPSRSSCVWAPAPYQMLGSGGDPGDYGNHDLSSRPGRQRVEYIVIHDIEGSFDSAINTVRNPNSVSWHYTVRSSDGYIAQHVRTKDVAWHAGNWFVNAKSVGIEHEGQAANGAWYTEALYRSSARLARFLIRHFSVPVNRDHIVGHDNIPGITPDNVRTMHWDPGPYWDWARYFELLNKPISRNATSGGMVIMRPRYERNRPAFYGCSGGATPCPARGSSDIVLRTEPRPDAPLVTDIGLRPDGSPSTMLISDTGARASMGQRFAVAGNSGEWTAIWYLGQKAWFHNPPHDPAARPYRGVVATPKAGRSSIPVYGRAYPEGSAYPPGVPEQPIVPLAYQMPAGQRYSVGLVLGSEYYRAVTFNGSSPGDWTVIRGATRYVQIQFGHRFMYVNRDDVDLLTV